MDADFLNAEWTLSEADPGVILVSPPDDGDPLVIVVDPDREMPDATAAAIAAHIVALHNAPLRRGGGR